MGMMINRRRACGGKKLPYDAEIEYLESTGTQYIDTGVYFDVLNINFEIGFTAEKFGAWGWVHQNVASGTWFSTANNPESFVCRYKDFNTKIVTTKRIDQYVVKITNNIFSIDNESYSINVRQGTDNISTVSLKFFLWYDFFRKNIESLTNRDHSVFKSFYIKINNTLVRDYIPVRVGNLGYMYDKVSGTLFGNAGTAAFILGPDKVTGVNT